MFDKVTRGKKHLHLLKISIYVYLKSGSTCKEAAILRHHRPTVNLFSFTLTSQLLQGRCEIEWGIRKQELMLFAICCLDISCYYSKSYTLGL